MQKKKKPRKRDGEREEKIAKCKDEIAFIL